MTNESLKDRKNIGVQILDDDHSELEECLGALEVATGDSNFNVQSVKGALEKLIEHVNGHFEQIGRAHV